MQYNSQYNKKKSHHQTQDSSNLFPNVTLDYIRTHAADADCSIGKFANVSVGADLTLSPKFLDVRSEVIATYALCGFANFSSIGIMLGALTAMAPRRSADLAAVVFRAMITANFACFMTACVAGLLSDVDGAGGGGVSVSNDRNCTLGWT